MTYDECEILADAACHLKAIASRMRDPENVREISYVLGMLATLPLVSEAAEARRCSFCGEPGCPEDPERFSARV